MTAIKQPGLESFLRKPDPSITAVLIYGDEAGAVRDLAARAVKQIAGSTDDPFAVVPLQDGDLSGNPGRLADEVQSLSMFGGARVIWVRDAGETFTKAAKPLLDGALSGNLVIAEAGTLPKSSQLRQMFEKSARALVLPLYEAESGELAGLVESILGNDGLRIDQDALHRFIELAGTTRSLVRREAEKLSTFCQGSAQVRIQDVETICGNTAAADPEELADSVMGGDVSGADRLFHILKDGGVDPGRLISAVHLHVMRLQDLKAAIETGASPDQAMRSARPMIFFKRQPKVKRQIRIWPTAELLSAGSTLGHAVQQARQNAQLSGAIASRCLLSIARRALALQRDQI